MAISYLHIVMIDTQAMTKGRESRRPVAPGYDGEERTHETIEASSARGYRIATAGHIAQIHKPARELVARKGSQRRIAR